MEGQQETSVNPKSIGVAETTGFGAYAVAIRTRGADPSWCGRSCTDRYC